MATPTKAALRERFRRYRAQLDDAAYAARSRAITEQVEALPAIAAATVIHAYWPMVVEREIDTRPLIQALLAAGKQIVLPVVLRFTRDVTIEPRLEHRRLTDPSDLRPNRWGLQEPSAGERVPPEALDAVIVPALGADRRGYRIGHGYGYYDEFLRTVTAPTIGLIYDACLVDVVPAVPHDVALRLLVTESGVLHPAARDARS